MLKIEILGDNKQLIEQHTLSPGSYRLGKSDLCDIRLFDSHVSRHHANLVVSERGAYISDAGSTNGTWKDSKRITRYGALKTGDAFQLGNLTLHVNYAENGDDHSREVEAPSLDASLVPAEVVSGGTRERLEEALTEPPMLSDVSAVSPPDAGALHANPIDRAAGFEETSKMAAQNPQPRAAEPTPAEAQVDAQDLPPVAPVSVEDIVEFEAHPPERKSQPGLKPPSRPEAEATPEAQAQPEPATQSEAEAQPEARPEAEPEAKPEAPAVAAETPKEGARGDRNLIKFLLKEANVTEVMINGPELIYVERSGIIEPVNTRFESAESLLRAVLQLLPARLRSFPVDPPIINTRLANGARINAIFPPVSRIGPVVTIRKSARRRFTIEDMVVAGILSREIVEFLTVCVKERRNVLIAGINSSGRTTLLEVLANLIPANERVIAIEETSEIRLHQDHVVVLESQSPGKVIEHPVSIRDLVVNAQHMRPQRIVLGECRGGEAFELLQSVNAGFRGLLSTIYGSAPEDALARLEMMTRLAGYDLPTSVVRELIVSAVDVVVHTKRYDDGRRRISKIVEVDGLDGNGFSVQPIFEFREDRAKSNGSISGTHVGCDYAPSFYAELEAGGAKLNKGIFASPAVSATHH